MIDKFFQPLPILFLALSLILTALLWLIWRRREYIDFIPGPKSLGATDKNLKLFYGWVPLILGLHVAIALLTNGLQGQLFFSNYTIDKAWSNWIGLIEITIALSLFYGGLSRPAAAILAIIWLLSIDLIGLKPMLNSIQYLGYASFFYLAGRGPFSIDRLLFPNLEPNVTYVNYALLLLRLCIGLNLIIFGFTKDLANIPLVSLLKDHLFMTIPNEIVVLLANALVILSGLLILFGIFPRTTALATLICLNASLSIYNWNELIDYLPLYGALAILLVWEPNNPKQKLLWVEGLRKNLDNG